MNAIPLWTFVAHPGCAWFSFAVEILPVLLFRSLRLAVGGSCRGAVSCAPRSLRTMPRWGSLVVVK